MKKGVIPAKILLPVIVFGLFISACTGNSSYDTEPASTATHDGTDSMMSVKTDTMMTDQTQVAPMDTNANRATVNSDTAARMNKDVPLKPKMDKSGKKGKVSIVPSDTKANTSAMEMDKEGFYKNTEVLPAYPGGQKALERFFEENIVYPDAATDNNAEGIVKLSFVVDENGKVSNPVAMGNQIGYGIEEEAIRIFKKMPAWTPGRIKGKNVKTRYTLPVRFQLY